MEHEAELIARINAVLSASGFWEEFHTDWVCLDCELMPWSAKAQSLLQQQYAPVGSAAQRALAESLTLLQRVEERHVRPRLWCARNNDCNSRGGTLTPTDDIVGPFTQSPICNSLRFTF